MTENEDDEKVVGMKGKLQQIDVLQTLEKISFQTAQKRDCGFQKFKCRFQENR